jgi:flavin reductase
VPVPAERFRQALAQWASGVTIVTSRSGDVVHGMTVSAFTSVSLDPPLVLVCADKASSTHGVIAESGSFAAHVLTAGQGELSSLFADKQREAERFVGRAWSEGATGAPILEEALAVLDCKVVAAHDAGDHVIYVGSVEEARLGAGEPLLYYHGRYRQLAE